MRTQHGPARNTCALPPQPSPLIPLYYVSPFKEKKGKEEKSKENGGDRVPSWLNES